MWLSASRVYHKQIAVVVAGSMIPWIAHLIYQVMQRTWILDLTPFAFAFSGVLFFIALFQYRLFNLVPIARATLYKNIPEGIAVFDRCQRVVDINESAERYLEITACDLGKPVDEVLADWPEILKAVEDLTRSTCIEVNRVKKDLPKWFDLELCPLYDERKMTSGQMLIIRDISTRKHTEEALQYQLKFEKLVARVSATFVNISSDRLNEAIDEALRLCGEFFHVDRSYIFIISGKTMSNTNEWCAEGIEPQMAKLQNFPVSALPWWAEQIHNADFVHIPDIEKLPWQAEAEKQEFKRQNIQSLLNIPILKDCRVAGFLGFDSVKKRKTWTEEQIALLKVIAEIIFSALIKYQYESQLKYISFHDSLTGLYNRSYFNNELKRLNTGREYPITIITTDLNELKLVNDTMGHAKGDELLQQYAEVVKKSLRSADILARVGGDEFAALLPRTSWEDGRKIISHIRSQELFYNQDSTKDRLPLSIAIGMATAENNKTTLDETFKEADDLMYRDKLQQGAGARSQIINAFQASLEERNFTVGDQVQRLTQLCQKIAEKLNLSTGQISNLSLLVKTHDLGNLIIPDRILFKNGQLTKEEWDIMRQHPEKGYRIAKFITELSGVAGLILRHHEKWDGTGYPLRIKGDDIPIECRILSIVDAYDAMTTNRPYRKAFSPEQAIREIKINAGTQFDPHLVEIFLTVLQEEGNANNMGMLR
jgi:diguanylate cyclase (GGDEF)-like protein